MATDNNSNLILVRLGKKFANRIFHEFHDDHPHKTANGGELLVTGDRIVQAAPTFAVKNAIASGILEEVRASDAVASPEPPDVIDVVNGVVTPGEGSGEDSEASAADGGAAVSKKSSK